MSLRQLYGVLGETDEDRDRRRLLEFIFRQGGTVTAREVARSGLCDQNSQVAEMALTELASDGYGELVGVRVP